MRTQTHYSGPDGIELVHGSVLDPQVLRRSLSGCEVVISALGIKRKNPFNPWSDLISPEYFTAQVMEILVPLMIEKNIRRFIGISAAGVGDSFQSVHPLIKWMISNSNMKASYNDLARMESILETSGLDWMTVRPVTLKNGEPTGNVKETGYYSLKSRIRRSELAYWILDKAEKESPFLKRTPMVCSE